MSLLDTDQAATVAEAPARPERCRCCGGHGYVYGLPRGKNPFLMSIEQIARRAVRKPCLACSTPFGLAKGTELS